MRARRGIARRYLAAARLALVVSSFLLVSSAGSAPAMAAAIPPGLVQPVDGPAQVDGTWLFDGRAQGSMSFLSLIQTGSLLSGFMIQAVRTVNGGVATSSTTLSGSVDAASVILKSASGDVELHGVAGLHSLILPAAFISPSQDAVFTRASQTAFNNLLWQWQTSAPPAS